MIEFSIVLGTYNRLSLLQKSLESFLTESNIEVIINDAGSTDGTIEWLQKQSSSDMRIKTILSGKITGITKAYNDCFKIANGKFITWFSDDLLLCKNGITEMCDLMSSIRPIDMGAFYINRGNEFTIPKFYGFPCPPVACMYLETLKKYEYWNLDYPYYSQDLEINFKTFRMGGQILSRKGLKVMHAPINDVQKIKNIAEHRKIGGPNKFQLVAGNYGKKMNFLYPRILVDSQKLIRKFKEHYKNIEIYTENVCPQFDLIIKEGNVIEPKNLSKGAVKFLEIVCG